MVHIDPDKLNKAVKKAGTASRLDKARGSTDFVDFSAAGAHPDQAEMLQQMQDAGHKFPSLKGLAKPGEPHARRATPPKAQQNLPPSKPKGGPVRS